MGRKLIYLILAVIVPGGLVALALAWLEQRYHLRSAVVRAWRRLVARNAHRRVDEEEQGVQRIGGGSRPALSPARDLAEA